jgi:hypothetical protein
MHNFDTLKAAGAPVEWAALLPNLHPGLSARSPHPNAGKLFIDFMLSQKARRSCAGQTNSGSHRYSPDPPTLLQGGRRHLPRPRSMMTSISTSSFIKKFSASSEAPALPKLESKS